MEKIINGDSKRYISYFQSKFDKDKIVIDKTPDYVINKPEKAIWASPVECKYSWKDWCEDEQWDVEYVDHKYFTLDYDTKLFTVADMDDIQYLIDHGYMTNKRFPNNNTKDSHVDFDNYFIRWNEIPYDAVELEDPCIGHRFINRAEMAFNSWDCCSICIINPNIILFE